MKRHQSEPVNNTNSIYDEIRERLTEAMKRVPKYEKLTTFSQSNTDIPGPGEYEISNSKLAFPSARSVKFLASGRFPKESSLPSIAPLNNTVDTIISDQISFSPPQKGYSAIEKNFITLQNTSQGHTTILSHNKSLSGSFSKANRDTRLTNAEILDVSPAHYHLKSFITPQNKKSGFSFGQKLNTSSDNVHTPGPGTYRVESVEINANHLRKQGPIILKSDSDALEAKQILKRSPVGNAYYQHSQFSCFNPEQSRAPSLGYGQKVNLASVNDIPGPGSYNLTPSPKNKEKSNPVTSQNFPSFGKPHSTRIWIQEHLPGPGEYDLIKESESNRGKFTFGTSKRPGLVEPRKEPEVDLTEPRFKKLLKVEAIASARSSNLQMKLKPTQEFTRFRKLIFDEIIEKSLNSPGFVYDVSKYGQIGSNKQGAKIGKSERGYVKALEQAKSIPGPGEYDAWKERELKHHKHHKEQKVSETKRPEHFVHKESYNIPGVGKYMVKNPTWGGKGGIIPQTKKDVAEVFGDNKQKKEKKKQDSYFDFLQNLDSKLDKAISEKKKTAITEEDSLLS